MLQAIKAVNHECLCPTITPSVQKCRPIQQLDQWPVGTNRDHIPMPIVPYMGQLAWTWATYREQGCPAADDDMEGRDHYQIHTSIYNIVQCCQFLPESSGIHRTDKCIVLGTRGSNCWWHQRINRTGITSDGREMSPVSIPDLFHPVPPYCLEGLYFADESKILLRNGGNTDLWQLLCRNIEAAIPIRSIALRGENCLSEQNVTTVQC